MSQTAERRGARPRRQNGGALTGSAAAFSKIKIKLPKSDEHDVIWGFI
jgi:hypothetical protein